MVNTVCVNADQGNDFHSFADHMTKFRQEFFFLGISIFTSVNA